MVKNPSLQLHVMSAVHSESVPHIDEIKVPDPLSSVVLHSATKPSAHHHTRIAISYTYTIDGFVHVGF